MVDLKKWGDPVEMKRKNEEEVCTPSKKTCGGHAVEKDNYNESLVLTSDDSKVVFPKHSELSIF